MRFRDEYRDSATARRLADAIAATVTRPWTLMEVCGGQTHAILRFGIDALLPSGLSLVHGLVQRLGGAIVAGPAPEGGAAFTVYLGDAP